MSLYSDLHVGPAVVLQIWKGTIGIKNANNSHREEKRFHDELENSYNLFIIHSATDNYHS